MEGYSQAVVGFFGCLRRKRRPERDAGRPARRGSLRRLHPGSFSPNATSPSRVQVCHSESNAVQLATPAPSSSSPLSRILSYVSFQYWSADSESGEEELQGLNPQASNSNHPLHTRSFHGTVDTSRSAYSDRSACRNAYSDTVGSSTSNCNSDGSTSRTSTSPQDQSRAHSAAVASSSTAALDESSRREWISSVSSTHGRYSAYLVTTSWNDQGVEGSGEEGSTIGTTRKALREDLGERSEFPLGELHESILACIFSHLSPRDLASVSQVSRTFYSACQLDNVWRRQLPAWSEAALGCVWPKPVLSPSAFHSARSASVLKLNRNCTAQYSYCTVQHLSGM